MWIWIVVGIFFLGLILLILTAIGGARHDRLSQTKEGIKINSGKSGTLRRFSDKELANANTAIAKGITIEDPQSDWYQFPAGSIQPDGRPDNPNPYPLGWTDFKSVSVGADEKYIYFKFRFWDNFPEKAVFYNGDLIQGTGAKITSFKFVGKDGKEDSADLDASVMYSSFSVKSVSADKPSVGQGAMISPYGRDAQMETLFKVNTSEGMVAGGPGQDFLLAAFQLSLFNLKLGDTVTFDSSTESGSNKFHHEAVDLLLGVPDFKFGQTIKYTLGSDKYEMIQNADYKDHS